MFVWTVNNPRAMRRLVRVGVNGITTNKPIELKNILNTNFNGKT